MSPLLSAIQLLTPLPVAGKHKARPADFGDAVAFFPVAGMIVGLVVLAACALAALDKSMMHSSLWSVVILALWAWFGSGLHLEGLADTLKGLASGQRGSAMLKTMREPSLGVGAVGLTLALLAKFLWLETITPNVYWMVPFPMIVSRGCQALACGLGRYAGGSRGAAKDYIQRAGLSQGLVGTGWTLALVGLFCLLGWFKMGVAPSQAAWALVACLLGFGCGFLGLIIAQKRLKGLSGHLLGFASEISEVSTAFFLVFLLTR